MFSGARVAVNLLDIVAIALIGLAVAIAFGSDDSIPLLGTIDFASRNALVFVTAGAGLLFLLKTTIGLTLAHQTLQYLAQIEVLMSMQIANSLFTGTLQDLKKNSRSEIEWAVLRSSNLAFSGLFSQAITFTAELSSVVFIFAALLYADWQIAFIATLYFSIILWIFHIFSRQIAEKAGATYAERSVGVAQALSDLVSAFREISVLSKRPVFLERLASARRDVARAQAANLFLASVPRYVVELGLILGAVAFLIWAVSFSVGPDRTAVFGIFVAGSLRMMSALLPLQRAFQAFRYDAPMARAAQDYLSGVRAKLDAEMLRKSEAKPNSLTTYDNSFGGSVEMRGVSFRHQDSLSPRLALDNVSAEIRPGSFIAFVGASGAGKSTAADIILGLEEPTEGEVLCSGVAPDVMRQLDPSYFAYVPQKPGLISGTILENVALGFGLESADLDRVYFALELASLREFVSGLPMGIHTELGKHVDSMSGGQLQRLGLARAFYAGAKLLILDEATSALDSTTEAAIAESVSGLSNVTVIAIAHRLSTVKRADSILVFDEGRIVASGTFSELRRSNSIVRDFIEHLSLD